MAADATELAVAYITLLPSLRDFSGTVEREVGGVGVRLGSEFGRDFARAATRSSGPDIRRLTAQLDAARGAQADAAGKVRIAEARLEEARRKTGATTARTVQAEENLAKAQRELATASARATSAADQHAAAQREMARGADKAGDELGDVATQARRAERAVGRAGRESKEGGRKMRTAFVGVGRLFAPLLALGAGAGVVSFFRQAGTAASDFVETGTKINQIYGVEGAAALQKFAEGSDQNLGQTKQQVLDAAATFGVFGKSAGLAGIDLTTFSTDFVKLATDMASFHNADPSEVIEALGSGLRGEAEPLRRFGVLLDDASLREEALRQGLIKTTKDALTPQQKVLAAQGLIMKQTSDAQGDFARTGEGLANQQRKAKAAAGELRREFGELLLPLFLKAVTVVNTQVLPALRAFVAGYKEGTGAGGAFRKVVEFVVGAVKALAGVFRGDAHPAVSGLAASFSRFGAVAGPIIRDIINRFRKDWPTIRPIVVDTIRIIRNFVLDILNQIRAGTDRFSSLTSGIWRKWGGTITGLITNALRTALGVFRGVLNIISGVVKVFTGVFTGDFRRAGEGVKQIFRGLGQVIVSLIRGSLNSILSVVKTIVGERVVNAFKTATGAIGRAWSGIQELAKKPVRFVVNTVLENGLLKAFRTISSAVGYGAGSNLHVSLPRGFRRGGFTGWGDPTDAAGVVHKKEYVFDEETVRLAGGPGIFDLWRRMIRRHKRRKDDVGDLGLPGYAAGGFVSALTWARSQRGKPYRMGAVGPGSYDCSGFMAAIQNKINGRNPHQRLYSTDSFSGGPANRAGFTRNRKSNFMIGVWPNGRGVGHMSGTLLGVNVESSGGVGVRVGGGARGYTNGLYDYRYGLNKGGSGGVIGAVKDFILGGFATVGAWFKSLIDKPLGALRELASNPYAQMAAAMPRAIVGSMTDKLETQIFDTGEGVLQPGWTMTYNGTGQPEYLRTAERWEADRGSGSDLPPLHIHGNVGYDPREILALQQRAARKARARRRIVGRSAA